MLSKDTVLTSYKPIKWHVPEEDDSLLAVDELKLFYDQAVEKMKGSHTDTLIMVDTNVVQISIYHHCIERSRVVVPKKYVAIYHLDKFESCEFQSDIKVAINGDPVLDTTITKAQFTENMEPQIQAYATLMEPYVYLNTNYVLELHWSFSIPLTDLGMSLTKQFQLPH